MNEYRDNMASHLLESFRMIQELLSEADFEESFPFIFGRPTEDNPTVALRNECGLLMRKAQMHINAVLRANKSNNIHSMAVHMRVILECAAPIFSKANAAVKGSQHELARILNESEYDFKYAMHKLGQGSVEEYEILQSLESARLEISIESGKAPRRVTISDKLKQIPSGEDWYNHLSKYFCKGDASPLTNAPFLGGVLPTDTKSLTTTLAILLDCVSEQVIKMLVGYGILLSAAEDDSQLFNEALDLLERKRADTKASRKAVLQDNVTE